MKNDYQVMMVIVTMTVDVVNIVIMITTVMTTMKLTNIHLFLPNASTQFFVALRCKPES
jgi:hypothetical protein